MFQNAFAILVVYDGIYQLIEVKSLILDSPKGHYTRRKGPVLFNGIYIYIYLYQFQKNANSNASVAILKSPNMHKDTLHASSPYIQPYHFKNKVVFRCFISFVRGGSVCNSLYIYIYSI
jgi:hypothetical protein